MEDYHQFYLLPGHNGCLLWKLGNFQDILSILTFRQICWYIFILKTYKVFEPLYFPTPFICPIFVLQDRVYISILSNRLCNLNFLSRSECDFYWLLRLFEVWPTSNIKTVFLWCYGPSNVSQISPVNTDWAISFNI